MLLLGTLGTLSSTATQPQPGPRAAAGLLPQDSRPVSSSEALDVGRRNGAALLLPNTTRCVTGARTKAPTRVLVSVRLPALGTHRGCFTELDVEQSWSLFGDFVVSGGLIADFFFLVDS